MKTSRHLTYANVVATLALVFAMGGSALAASKYLITSTKQISPKVVKSLKGKNGKAGAVGPAGPQGKEGAAGKEATNAVNSQSLGGIPAAGYTRNDCNSLTGQTKGFALVPGESKFSATFVKVTDAYNCSGQEVQAKRLGEGKYEVKFVESPVTIAVGNVLDIASFFDNAFVSFKGLGLEISKPKFTTLSKAKTRIDRFRSSRRKSAKAGELKQSHMGSPVAGRI